MKKIGISGIPCTGKSTLAIALINECHKLNKFKSIELISEYARSYISKHNSIKFLWEQNIIINKQIEYEEVFYNKVDIFITDSPIYLGFFYATNLIDFSNSKEIILYNDIFKKFTNYINRYDFIIHLEPVLNLIEDGVRPELHFDKKWRETANSSILQIFNMFGQKNVFKISNNNFDERLKICLKLLNL